MGAATCMHIVIAIALPYDDDYDELVNIIDGQGRATWAEDNDKINNINHFMIFDRDDGWWYRRGGGESEAASVRYDSPSYQSYVLLRR